MRLLFILAACASMTQLSAQMNTGFYGRKLFCEVNSSNHLNVFSSVFNGNRIFYKRNGNLLTPGKDLFNTAVNVVFGGAVSSKTALSIEAGMFFGSFAAPGYLSKSDPDYYSNTIEMRHEMIDFRSVMIMPKIEISEKGSNSPSGLTHQIGIGFVQTKVIKKDYLYRIDYASLDTASADLSNTLLDYSNKYKGITLMYALNMRTPINKRMFFNYGIRYTANFSKKNFPPANENYWMSESDVGLYVRRTRQLSLIGLQLGFSFML